MSEEETITEEQIAANYTAMGHSVDLINNGTKEIWMSDDEWTATIECNKEHLRIMRAKDYWTDEDMTADDAAIGD